MRWCADLGAEGGGGPVEQQALDAGGWGEGAREASGAAASKSGSGLDLSDGGMRMAVWSRSMLGLPVRRPIACGRVH